MRAKQQNATPQVTTVVLISDDNANLLRALKSNPELITIGVEIRERSYAFTLLNKECSRDVVLKFIDVHLYKKNPRIGQDEHQETLRKIRNKGHAATGINIRTHRDHDRIVADTISELKKAMHHH